VRLAEVVVTPSRFGVRENPTALAATLTSGDLETLPQLGEDLYRTIARLPGVTADDFTASFWVRGAPNDKVLARLDGVELLEPFHLKDVDGALSIVDLQSVGQLDLITGGFTADFGDRLAGVLTMETASHTGSAARSEIGLSLTGVRAANQGNFAGTRGQWLITARRGYPDLALRAEGRANEVFPRYWDASAKIAYEVAPGHTLSVHALHADDTMRVHENNHPTLTSRYASDYAWARWRGAWQDRLTGEAVLSYSALGWERKGDGLFDQRLKLNLLDERSLEVVTLRQDWALTLNEQALLRAGLDLRTSSARYDYSLLREDNAVSNGAQIIATRTATVHLQPAGDTVGAFLAPRWRIGSALTVEPSLRFDRHTATGDQAMSPRFNASLRLGPGTSLRAAWGIYRQSQGLHQIAVQDGDLGFDPAEHAEHRVLGLEHRLPSGVALRAELYERRTTQPRPYWDNPILIYSIFPEIQSDRLRFAPTSNRARGLELLAARHVERGFGWSASYALAVADQLVASRTIPVPRDQRHTLYADASYAPNAKWRFSAAWQYHTGWPATDVSYTLIPLNNNRRLLQRVIGPAYAEQLPAYHRLDLRATRRWALRHGELRGFADVFNAYDHQNILGYDYSAVVQGAAATTARKPKDLLPILPSVGLEWQF